jgi:hypothetical protein
MLLVETRLRPNRQNDINFMLSPIMVILRRPGSNQQAIGNQAAGRKQAKIPSPVVLYDQPNHRAAFDLPYLSTQVASIKLFGSKHLDTWQHVAERAAPGMNRSVHDHEGC